MFGRDACNFNCNPIRFPLPIAEQFLRRTVFNSNCNTMRFPNQLRNKFFTETIGISEFQIHTFSVPNCQQMHHRNDCNFTLPNPYVFSTNCLTNSSKQRLQFHNSKSIRFLHRFVETLWGNISNCLQLCNCLFWRSGSMWTNGGTIGVSQMFALHRFFKICLFIPL